MTKEEFSDLMLIFFGPKRPELRLGQHIFNTLYAHNEVLCNRIIPHNSEGCDPFYRDDKIGEFLQHLSNHVEW